METATNKQPETGPEKQPEKEKTDTTANLIKYADMSPEEKHNFHVAGGKARAKEKRERKTFRDSLLEMLKDNKLAPIIAAANGDEILIEAAKDGATVQDLINLATLNQCLSGNMKSVEFVRDTIGEKPKEDIQINADIVTAADRKLIENLRNRLSIGENAQEEEQQ